MPCWPFDNNDPHRAGRACDGSVHFTTACLAFKRPATLHTGNANANGGSRLLPAYSRQWFLSYTYLNTSAIQNVGFSLLLFLFVFFLPVVSLDDTSPNGEGSIREYFCGEETGDAIGAHRLLLGEAWLISGSKSRVLFRVAPQAITPKCV